MNACVLTSTRLERLLRGTLTDAEAGELAAHLATDCAECDGALDRAGLDEETLLALLLARSERAQPNLRVVEGAGPKTKAKLGTRLVRRLAGASVVAGLAAAALLIAVRQEAPLPDGVPAGTKGEAPSPRALLELTRAAGSVATWRFAYVLDRDAFGALWHRRPDGGIEKLASPRLVAVTGGPGSMAAPGGGTLGYDFTGEPGSHLFCLLVADSPLEDEASRALVARASAEPWQEVHVGVVRAGVSCTRHLASQGRR